MGRTWLLIVVSALLGQAPVAKDDPAAREAARNKRERLLQRYTSEAAEYTIYRDASRKDKLELQARAGLCLDQLHFGEDGQDGAVFVWTCRGRAEVIGSIFMSPTPRPRHVYHEFHSLALSVLDVQRSGTPAKNWTPLCSGRECDADRGGGFSITGSRTAARPDADAFTTDFTAATLDHKDRQLGTAPASSIPLPLREHGSRRPRWSGIRDSSRQRGPTSRRFW